MLRYFVFSLFLLNAGIGSADDGTVFLKEGGLNPAFIERFSDRATVERYFCVSEADERSALVLFIEDCPGDSAVQMRVSAIIERIAHSYGTTLVVIPGPEGPLFAQPFSNFPNKDILKTISEQLLTQKVLTGVEYCMLVNSRAYSLLLYGLGNDSIKTIQTLLTQKTPRLLCVAPSPVISVLSGQLKENDISYAVIVPKLEKIDKKQIKEGELSIPFAKQTSIRLSRELLKHSGCSSETIDVFLARWLTDTSGNVITMPITHLTTLLEVVSELYSESILGIMYRLSLNARALELAVYSARDEIRPFLTDIKNMLVNPIEQRLAIIESPKRFIYAHQKKVIDGIITEFLQVHPGIKNKVSVDILTFFVARTFAFLGNYEEYSPDTLKTIVNTALEQGLDRFEEAGMLSFARAFTEETDSVRNTIKLQQSESLTKELLHSCPWLSSSERDIITAIWETFSITTLTKYREILLVHLTELFNDSKRKLQEYEVSVQEIVLSCALTVRELLHDVQGTKKVQESIFLLFRRNPWLTEEGMRDMYQLFSLKEFSEIFLLFTRLNIPEREMLDLLEVTFRIKWYNPDLPEKKSLRVQKILKDALKEYRLTFERADAITNRFLSVSPWLRNYISADDLDRILAKSYLILQSIGMFSDETIQRLINSALSMGKAQVKDSGMLAIELYLEDEIARGLNRRKLLLAEEIAEALIQREPGLASRQTEIVEALWDVFPVQALLGTVDVLVDALAYEIKKATSEMNVELFSFESVFQTYARSSVSRYVQRFSIYQEGMMLYDIGTLWIDQQTGMLKISPPEISSQITEQMREVFLGSWANYPTVNKFIGKGNVFVIPSSKDIHSMKTFLKENRYIDTKTKQLLSSLISFLENNEKANLEFEDTRFVVFINNDFVSKKEGDFSLALFGIAPEGVSTVYLAGNALLKFLSDDTTVSFFADLMDMQIHRKRNLLATGLTVDSRTTKELAAEMNLTLEGMLSQVANYIHERSKQTDPYDLQLMDGSELLSYLNHNVLEACLPLLGNMIKETRKKRVGE